MNFFVENFKKISYQSFDVVSILFFAEKPFYRNFGKSRLEKDCSQGRTFGQRLSGRTRTVISGRTDTTSTSPGLALHQISYFPKSSEREDYK
jgi:hypothetical protein